MTKDSTKKELEEHQVEQEVREAYAALRFQNRAWKDGIRLVSPTPQTLGQAIFEALERAYSDIQPPKSWDAMPERERALFTAAADLLLDDYGLVSLDESTPVRGGIWELSQTSLAAFEPKPDPSLARMVDLMQEFLELQPGKQSKTRRELEETRRELEAERKCSQAQQETLDKVYRLLNTPIKPGGALVPEDLPLAAMALLKQHVSTEALQKVIAGCHSIVGGGVIPKEKDDFLFLDHQPQS